MVSDLVQLGRELGSDPMLVQGAGGNISVKDGDRLTVKASGVWLRECEKPSSFVTLDLGRARTLAGDGVEDLREALEQPGTARPSIETAFHALLPDRVVIHVHSIHTLAHAVRVDGESRIASKLHGISWSWVRYARPGLPLAQEMLRSNSASSRVYVLQNHGLIVTGDSVAEARERLYDVEQRLAVTPRPVASTDSAGFNPPPRSWRAPHHRLTHLLATDPAALKILQRGALYPDQVVFLGARPTLGLPGEGTGPQPPYVVIPDRQVFVNASKGPIVDEMLLGHALLLQRIDSLELRTLSAGETGALVGWEAETYRQGLSRHVAA